MGAVAVRRALVLGAFLALLAVLSAAGPSTALATESVSINSVSQPTPYVAESVTFTALASASDASCGTGPFTYSWFVDDGPSELQQTPSGASTFTRAFSTVGDHLVSVNANQLDCPATDSVHVHVVNPIAGSIGASPQSPGIDQPVTLTANVSGGYNNLTYAWDTTGTGIGAFTPGASSVQASFSTAGSHTVRLRVTDSATPAHQKDFSLVLSTTSCKQRLDFGLAEVTTSGCMSPSGSANPQSYTTSDPIKVNGIPIPAPPPGLHFTISLPGPSTPGGEIALGSTEISLDGVAVFKGAIDWKLPAGVQGDEKQVAALNVPGGLKIKGLSVGGSIALHLGWAADGTHYATFPMNIALPDVFRSGPAKQSGGVSASGSIRVDARGVHYDGLRLEAHNVWVGQLQVQQVCFSFVPGGSQAVTPCQPPSLDGQPYLTCNDDVSTDRWDGNAVLVLPTSSHPRLAMFGGVAAGKLSKLGGFVDHLGTSVPIAEGIYLTRVGVGLCVYPPPFKLRGDVGISALPVGGKDALTINGSFLFTDAFGADPWSLALSGNMSLYDRQVGDGTLTIRPTGSIDFGLHAHFSLFSVVSVDGSIVGWLELPRHSFNIDGTVRGCIKSVCASAEGVLSSVGVAGCLSLGTITYGVLVKNHNWHWYTPWRVHWETRHTNIQAGFGYRWHASSVSLFGGSCDMGSFSARRSSVARAASGAFALHVASGTQALGLRIAGSGRPFRVLLRGPGGQRIVTPADGSAVSRPGQFLLAPNTPDGSIGVLLIKPDPGVWHVSAEPGSTVSSVQNAPFVAPPAIAGSVVSGRDGRRIVALSYALPADEAMSLVERGSRSEHTIIARVGGHRCPGPNRPGGEQLKCAQVRFTAAFGPAGRRQIDAVITRGGVPVETLPVASFTVRAPSTPARPGRLKLVRGSGGVVLAWAGVRGATSYATSIKLSDGRMLGRTVSGRCRGVLFRSVSGKVGASAEVAGLRPDLVSGPFGRLALKPNKSRAGASGGLPKQIC